MLHDAVRHLRHQTPSVNHACFFLFLFFFFFFFLLREYGFFAAPVFPRSVDVLTFTISAGMLS
jgi:hypothetical protein